MTKTEVMSKLQEIFDGLFLDRVVLTDTLRAKDVEEWDSMMQITLVVAVEKTLNVRFRTGEVENTTNVGEFVDLILKRMSER
jgi:acyl carrier protein